jgi:hypothetical protein
MGLPDRAQSVVQLPAGTPVTLALASLPHDVLVAVLSNVLDLDTLLAIIASCRAFYSAFKSSPTPIIRDLAFRIIGIAVLPDSILATLARNAGPCRLTGPEEAIVAAVLELLNRRGDEALLTTHKWTAAEGMATIRLHSIIDDMARRFAAFHLSQLERVSGRQQKAPANQELVRIKRALYRFEVFCTLFPPQDRDKQEIPTPSFNAQEAFFGTASPWENEEFFIVLESLRRLVAPGTYLQLESQTSPLDTGIDY